MRCSRRWRADLRGRGLSDLDVPGAHGTQSAANQKARSDRPLLPPFLFFNLSEAPCVTDDHQPPPTLRRSADPRWLIMQRSLPGGQRSTVRARSKQRWCLVEEGRRIKWFHLKVFCSSLILVFHFYSGMNSLFFMFTLLCLYSSVAEQWIFNTQNDDFKQKSGTSQRHQAKPPKQLK